MISIIHVILVVMVSITMARVIITMMVVEMTLVMVLTINGDAGCNYLVSLSSPICLVLHVLIQFYRLNSFYVFIQYLHIHLICLSN